MILVVRGFDLPVGSKGVVVKVVGSVIGKRSVGVGGRRKGALGPDFSQHHLLLGAWWGQRAWCCGRWVEVGESRP